MVAAHGYTQSSRQTWNNFDHDHDPLWPQTYDPVFDITPQTPTHSCP